MISLDPDHPLSLPASQTRKTSLPGLRTLTGFLTKAQEAVRLEGEVSVMLTSDEGIRLLNQRFRKQNKPTDVLSFPSDMPGVAGDLAVSVETAAKQAAEMDHSLSAEIKILFLHGLLHLAGYDHEVDNGKMARREILLRKQLGLPVALIERAAKGAWR
jgi:probable rRNA maturation factor